MARGIIEQIHVRLCAMPRCGVELGHNDQRVRYCGVHKNPASRAADLRRAAAKGDPTAKKAMQHLGLSPESPVASSDFAELQRFAIFLGGLGNASQAAELAGLKLRGDALAAYEARARAECADLVEGRQSAATSLGNVALLLLLQRMTLLAPTLPGPQIGASLKQLGDVLERLQGGLQPVYSDVRVEVSLDDPEAP